VAGFVVTGVLGLALVWYAVRAWRLGRLELPVGESSPQLLRGSASFVLAELLLLASGAALLALAVIDAREEFAPEGDTFRSFDGDGYRIDVPARWDPAPELIEEGMQQAGFAAVAFAWRDEELVVMSPPAATAIVIGDGTPAEVAGALLGASYGMRSPVIRYREWTVTRKERHIDIHMRYPAPRGDVVGRIVAAIDQQRRLRSFHAVCSHDGGSSDCERIVDSLLLTLPQAELLPVGVLPAASSSAGNPASSPASNSAQPQLQ